MTALALCQSHPEAATELGLLAIFAACQANKAALAQDRQAQADKRLAEGRYWWREDNGLALARAGAENSNEATDTQDGNKH